jgi:probable F420-dependent oxidoreductase
MALLPQRNPVYTAKEVASLDYLSAGRVDFGVGVGWLREEFEAVNVEWADRGRRTDEYLEVLRALWCDEVSSYDGSFHRLPPCRMDPKPVQQPHPPVHVGGESDAALRRVARAGQGWATFNRAADELAAPLSRLDALLAERGRSRAEVQITACPYFKPFDTDQVAAYAAAGVDRIAVLFLAADPAGVEAAFDALQPTLDRARSLSG